MPLVRLIHCKYLQLSDLLFHSLNLMFWKTEMFDFNGVEFINLFFLLVFYVLLKTCLLISKSNHSTSLSLRNLLCIFLHGGLQSIWHWFLCVVSAEYVVHLFNFPHGCLKELIPFIERKYLHCIAVASFHKLTITDSITVRLFVNSILDDLPICLACSFNTL